MPDGIYFGLPAKAYHRLRRLSTSGIQALCVSAATFWEGSWLNPANDDPEAQDESTKAQIVGTAYHTARLEPEMFDDCYVRQLDKAEMPDGTVFTGPDMARELESMGLPKSGSVMEQARRLRDNGFPRTVWQIELARWEAARAGRIGLAAEVFDDIATDMARIRSMPTVAELLSDGAAEVTLLWTCRKTGLPMKCRVDYLKAISWLDFKTFENSKRKRLKQAISDEFRYNRYYIQAEVYRDGIEMMRSGLIDLAGEATEAQRDLVAAIQLSPAPLSCWYVFQQKGGIPNVLARRFKFGDLPPSHFVNRAGLSPEREAAAAQAVGRRTAISIKAGVEIDHAKRTFLAYSEIYEPGDPWLPFDPLGEIGDEDFSAGWLEGKYE